MTKAPAKTRPARKNKPTSMVFTEEQKARLDQFAAELQVGRVEAIMTAIEEFKGQGTISRERLLQEITRRLR